MEPFGWFVTIVVIACFSGVAWRLRRGEHVSEPDPEPAPVYDAESADIYALAYDEAIRSLDQQAVTLANLRSRATTLLAFAATIGGLLVTAIASGTDFTGAEFWPLVVVGAGGAIVVLGLAIEVARPRPFRFRRRATSIMHDYGSLPLPEAHFYLAWWHDVDHHANEESLGHLHRCFAAMLIGLVLEVGAWGALVGLVR